MSPQERRIEAVRLAISVAGSLMQPEAILLLARDIDQFIDDGITPGGENHWDSLKVNSPVARPNG